MSEEGDPGFRPSRGIPRGHGPGTTGGNSSGRSGLSAPQLAQAARVPADQIDEWVECGLISPDAAGLFDGEDVERARLLHEAVRRGITGDDIAHTLRADTGLLDRYVQRLQGLSRLPVGRADEAAERVGLDPWLVRRLWAAMGFDDEAAVYEDDIETARWLLAAMDAGFPEEALLQMVKVYTDALGRVADAETRLFHFYVHERLHAEGLTGDALAAATDETGVSLIKMVEPALLYFHRKAWERAVREDVLFHFTQDLRADSGDIGRLPVAVLFVDLASFTPLTEAIGDRAAADVVNRFSDLVRGAAARCDGRLVKQIGDEFMLVFPGADTAVRCALDIAARAAHEPDLPPVRMGAHAGTALFREADYLGATVNVAARVASEAGRGQLLVTDSIRDAVTDEAVVWKPIGRRPLKGVGEPPMLYEAGVGGSHRDHTTDTMQ